MGSPTTKEDFQATRDGEAIDVRWLMPEEFFEFPLDYEDMDATTDQLLELAARVLPGADLEIQVEWAAMCGANYDSFFEGGVQYAGFCIAEIAGERCTATVNVSVFDLDALDPGRFGQRPVNLIASTLRGLGIGEVAEIELPCGPAVSCIGSRVNTVSAELTASGSEQPMSSSFIQVQIPLTNSTVIVLEMSTPTMAAWDAFSKMFAGIVRGVRLFDTEGNPVVMPR